MAGLAVPMPKRLTKAQKALKPHPIRGICPNAVRHGALNHHTLIIKARGAMWEACIYCFHAFRVHPSDKDGAVNHIKLRRKDVLG